MRHDAEIDLAVGYPQFSNTKWLTTLWRDSSLAELAASFRDAHPEVPVNVTTGLPRHEDLTDQTLRAVCRFLGVDDELARYGCITYSGSHALERAIATCLTGTVDANLVITDPCIDIIPAMVEECNATPRCVRAPSLQEVPHVEDLIEAVDERSAGLVVCSPENPTGAVYSEEAFVELSASLDPRVPLIVDQSFLKIAPEQPVPSFLGQPPADRSWVFMWDTGKTLGMADGKLGFLFASPDMFPVIASRLEVLQYNLPAYSMLLADAALDAASQHDYAQYLSERVRENGAEAMAMLDASSARPLSPDAGGFLLVDVSRLGDDRTGAQLAADLLAEERVGVVGGERFFHCGPPPVALWRIALTRDRDVVREGMSRIVAFLERHAGG